ncbi:MAG: 3'-5' exonuclease, partial [Anaerolineaceae bacterium]|nr:3'-5' exonuclease [Anaerolineaceae bacterium]
LQMTKVNPTRVLERLHAFGPIENFIWPDENQLALQYEERISGAADIWPLIEQFREVVRRWQQATLLPAGQLVLTIAQDIHFQPQDLALDYKLAVLLDGAANQHADWRLPDLALELDRVVKNEYKLVGFSDEDLGFNPDLHKGKVVVATVHKAKGLEWDRVDLTSVNNYDFPSLQETDVYQSEKWFIKGRRNLEAEGIFQLEAVIKGDPQGWNLEPEEIKRIARVGYAAERLRLLYVAITRAKQELHVTWNTGRKGELHEAVPLSELIGWWEKERSNAAAA